MSESPRAEAQSGFSLFELLVVLALVSLLAGLAAPRASQWLEAAEIRGWRADLRARIQMLPSQAFRSGEALSVDRTKLLAGMAGKPAALEVRLEVPLEYAASGLAEGGVVELVQGASRERWIVAPITGEVRIATAGSP